MTTIAHIAQHYVARIRKILENAQEDSVIFAYAQQLRHYIHSPISDEEIVDLLVQYCMTKPILQDLFGQSSHLSSNPMTKLMNEWQEEMGIFLSKTETQIIQDMYVCVTSSVSAGDASATQKKIIDFYEAFFSEAFPRLRSLLGIVYTPIEIVDFIVHSVNEILTTEFAQTLGSPSVQILDPFTGMGIFLTRLLHSGLIPLDQLQNTYQHTLYANEIIPFSYYIAMLNIESVYHTVTDERYSSFSGIRCLDTFQIQEDTVARFQDTPQAIRILLGNPPYCAGQEWKCDFSKQEYVHIDQRIQETYISLSNNRGGKRAGYDSYIRALRWASDWMGERGVVAFVCGSGFMEKPAFDGIRKSMCSEFSSLYIVNLRGDIRKNMLSHGRAKEGQNIFDKGSMTGIAIAILIKNPHSQKKGQVYYHDIGDALSVEEKRLRISTYKSISGISAQKLWREIIPDSYGDWIQQRNQDFYQHLLMGTKDKCVQSVLFSCYSNGIVSNRDPWVYHFSRVELEKHCSRMIRFYNAELERYAAYLEKGGKPLGRKQISSFVRTDPSQISWGGGNWPSAFRKCRKEVFVQEDIRMVVYRPFTKMWHYGAKTFNHSFYMMPSLFPTPTTYNRVICVSGVGARSGFSVLMVDCIPDLQALDNGNCFPLYRYEESNNGESALVWQQRAGISDEGLISFRKAYPSESIEKEDIFYYTYGLLHSVEYRELYTANLSKELARIPMVKKTSDFWNIVSAGRRLAELHLHYEQAPLYPVRMIVDSIEMIPERYRVEKMRFAKKKVGGKQVLDRSVVHYNEYIQICDIPSQAYEYVVNGKSAILWVMEQQSRKSDAKSTITKDPNLWALETMDNPKYPLELLLRVITVSIETMDIVASLPVLEV